MPTAPALNRPPRLDEQQRAWNDWWTDRRANRDRGFARPPGDRQTPTGGSNRSLMGAAVNRSVGSPNNAVGDMVNRGPFNGQVGQELRERGSTFQPNRSPGQDVPVGRPNTAAAPSGWGRSANPFTKPPPAGSVKTPTQTTGPTPGSNPTVQDPNAPPGTPDTGAQFNIPLVPADETAKADAQTTYTDATANAMSAIQGAALGYGDPGLMRAWGLPAGTQNPNSALALAALKAQQQQEAATNARERAGTLFSSLALQDRDKIAATQQRTQLAGYQRYQNALAKFNQAITAAQDARSKAIDAANLDERQSALNTLPTADTTASGGFQTGSNSITGKITKPAPIKVVKNPLLKLPKDNRTTKAGKGKSTKVTSNAPKGTSKVKVGTRRISGGKPRG